MHTHFSTFSVTVINKRKFRKKKEVMCNSADSSKSMQPFSADILYSHLSNNFLCTNPKVQYYMHIIVLPTLHSFILVLSPSSQFLFQFFLEIARFSRFRFHSHYKLKCFASNHFLMVSRVLVLSLKNI